MLPKLIVIMVVFLLIPLYIVFAEENAETFGEIEFCGVLEEEFGYILSEGDDESDFALSKAELGADVSLGPNVAGHLLLLYEQGENDDRIVIDEGTIDLGISVPIPAELSLSIGLMVIPFGEFNSHFITDPFTLEIGETKQVAPKLSASIREILEVSVAAYNEEVDTKNSGFHISDMAFRIAASLLRSSPVKDINLTTGISLITNMAGTDGLTDTIGENVVISDRALGIGNFVSMSVMGTFLEWEATAALNEIEIINGEILKPRAFNIELGYSMQNIPVEIAGKFEHFSQSDGNSINRFGGLIAIALFDDAASLALEFLRSDDGDSAENSIVSQLAVEF